MLLYLVYIMLLCYIFFRYYTITVTITILLVKAILWLYPVYHYFVHIILYMK